jgi:hypothetical protein
MLLLERIRIVVILIKRDFGLVFQRLIKKLHRLAIR